MTTPGPNGLLHPHLREILRTLSTPQRATTAYLPQKMIWTADCGISALMCTCGAGGSGRWGGKSLNIGKFGSSISRSYNRLLVGLLFWRAYWHLVGVHTLVIYSIYLGVPHCDMAYRRGGIFTGSFFSYLPCLSLACKSKYSIRVWCCWFVWY